jgi:hypothetical protein
MAPNFVTNIPPRDIATRHITSALLSDLGISSGSRSIGETGATAAGEEAIHRRQLADKEAVTLGTHPKAPSFCAQSAANNLYQPVSGSGRSSQILQKDPAKMNPSSTAAHYESSNWTGYAVTEADFGSPIDYATGEWVVGQGPTPGSPSASSTWVGVGGGLGEGSNVVGLIQEGTQMETNAGFQSWFEWIGTNAAGGQTGVNEQDQSTSGVKFVNNNTIQPGDTVTAFVNWASQTEACFLFANLSENSGSFSGCQTNLNIAYDHTSAEWIDERTRFSNSGCPGAPNGDTHCYWYYANPGTTYWTNQQLAPGFSSAGSQSPFSYPFEALVLQTPGTFTEPSPSCSENDVLGYPVNASTSNGAGSSQILYCRDGSMYYFP